MTHLSFNPNLGEFIQTLSKPINESQPHPLGSLFEIIKPLIDAREQEQRTSHLQFIQPDNMKKYGFDAVNITDDIVEYHNDGDHQYNREGNRDHKGHLKLIINYSNSSDWVFLKISKLNKTKFRIIYSGICRSESFFLELIKSVY